MMAAFTADPPRVSSLREAAAALGALAVGGVIIGLFWALLGPRIAVPAWQMAALPAALAGLAAGAVLRGRAGRLSFAVVGVLLTLGSAGWSEWSRFAQDFHRRLELAQATASPTSANLSRILAQVAAQANAELDPSAELHSPASPAGEPPSAPPADRADLLAETGPPHGEQASVTPVITSLFRSYLYRSWPWVLLSLALSAFMVYQGQALTAGPREEASGG